MIKYYRVKKDNFLWKEGAILSDQGEGEYRAVENIWDNTKGDNTEYISARIIEDEYNYEYFERVYPDTLTGKLYRTKDQLLQLYINTFS